MTTTFEIMTDVLASRPGAPSVAGLPLPEQAISVKQHIGCVPEAAVLATTAGTGAATWFLARNSLDRPAGNMRSCSPLTPVSRRSSTAKSSFEHACNRPTPHATSTLDVNPLTW
jgi:hypothetical protein